MYFYFHSNMCLWLYGSIVQPKCSTESSFYKWSALDFSEKISLNQRSKILEELFEMFSRECTFTICEYKSTKENDLEPALWEGFKVKMIYEKKIRCDKTELVEDLKHFMAKVL